MQKITPFLWFDGKAEEAMNFYISIFENSKIVSLTRYGEEGPGPKGTVMTATFQLDGQEFFALNGGPQFTFSPAISFFVNCETQQEVDELWEKLSEGGEKLRCGWLRDKYGLSWQVIPSVLGKMLQDKDAEKSRKVMKAMLQMDKIDCRTRTTEKERGMLVSKSVWKERITMKIATVDDFVKLKVAPEHKAIVASLRKLMKQYAPDAKEGISYGILAWKQRRMLAVISPTMKDITFAFARGAEFTDKYGLLQGVGKVSKHVKIKSVADINNTALRDYIKQAVKFQNR